MSEEEKLTIAQALRRVKKLKGQIAECQLRAKSGVTYDVTKLPAFRYQEAVDSMFLLQGEMVDLETKIAVANATNLVKGEPMAKAVRTLQELKGRIAFLNGLTIRNETVKDRQSEWDDTEMKTLNRVTETTFASDLSEQDRDKQVKALQNYFEALNNAVENANHNVLV